MKQFTLGQSSLTCSRLAYGCWRIAGTWTPSEVNDAWRANGRQALLTAFEAGYTLFDHADIYCDGEPEKIFGQVLREVSGTTFLVATHDLGVASRADRQLRLVDGTLAGGSRI